jgi:hypothetical protein
VHRRGSRLRRVVVRQWGVRTSLQRGRGALAVQAGVAGPRLLGRHVGHEQPVMPVLAWRSTTARKCRVVAGPAARPAAPVSAVGTWRAPVSSRKSKRRPLHPAKWGAPGVVPAVKKNVAVSPLGVVGGKPTREHRTRMRSQRSGRLQFPALGAPPIKREPSRLCRKRLKAN